MDIVSFTRCDINLQGKRRGCVTITFSYPSAINKAGNNVDLPATEKKRTFLLEDRIGCEAIH